MTEIQESGDTSGNQPRCPARNRSGRPCDAVPTPGSTFCIWHDPDRADDRKMWSVKGGRSSSNESRARKRLTSTTAQLGDLMPVLFATIDDVREGSVTPQVASSIANLARAVVQVSSAADIEARIAELEARLGVAS